MRLWHLRDDAETNWAGEPSRTQVCVDFQVEDGSWRRMVVATRGFLSRTLGDLDGSPGGAAWTLLPQMAVIPDGDPDERRAVIDAIVQGGLLDKHVDAIQP